MLELLALALTVARLASAQDMTAEVTSAPSDTDLLAYTTITTACLPDVDSNNEPIFSIQTNTDIASCTYVVNADNTAQVVSTIGAVSTATPADTASDSVPLSTMTMADPTVTSDSTVPTDSTNTGSDSSTPDATVPETSTNGMVSGPTATPTGLAVGRFALGGEVLGFVGVMAVLAAL